MTRPDLAAWAERRGIIVLEGCDGAGKTTIAEQLADRYGYRIVHASLSPDGTDLVAKYHAVIASPGPLVLDRCFISELVYGPLVRGQSRLTFGQVANLASAAARRSGVLVHLTGRPERIAARIAAREGRSPELSRIRAVTAAYIDIFAQLKDYAPVITIDTTTASTDQA